MRFPDKLKKLRQYRRLSQGELAEKLRLSQPMVSSWERGVNAPDAYQLAALAAALDTTADYLVRETDERLGNELEAERKVREVIEVIGWDAAYARMVGNAGGVEPKLVPPPARPQTKHEAG